MNKRTYRPFGEFLPDQRLIANEGLIRAFGVTPIAGNYIASPGLKGVSADSVTEADTLTEEPFGFGLHQQLSGANRNTFGYYGSKTKLYEIDIAASTPGVLSETDRSRLVGGAYAFTATPPLDTEFWWFVSYGDSVVATNLNDETQFLQTPGSGNFENMITSTFKPQGRIAFVIKQNLFLAYCFLPATYDGIPAGTNQQLVVWSMNDNIRAFGAEEVDPALIGAGYQQGVGGDLGPITAAIGGDYGLIFLAGGIVRVDGPPYEFRPIVIADTTLYPYSVFRMGGDVYFWGSGGPSVLRGGEAPVIRLGSGRIQRSLLDNSTSFGQDFARIPTLSTREVSGGPDPVNDLVRFQYDPYKGADIGGDLEDPDLTSPTVLLDFSLGDGRCSASRSPAMEVTFNVTPRDRFLRFAPLTEEQTWGPFGSIYCLQEAYSLSTWRMGRYQVKPRAMHDPPDIHLQTGFGRLDDNLLTKVVAVRPVWSQYTQITPAAMEGRMQIQVESRNKPWEPSNLSSVHTEFNDDGWVGTDSAWMAAQHSVSIKILAVGFDEVTLPEIHELEGLEIEYATGGAYGA